jgi:hypothetical protein
MQFLLLQLMIGLAVVKQQLLQRAQAGVPATPHLQQLQ